MHSDMDQRRLAFLRLLRRHHAGVLRLSEDDVVQVRFVLQPSTGKPVMPLAPRVLDAGNVVLCLPDDALENPECLQLHGELEPIDPLREGACDRWLASFGKAPTATWGVLHVQTAKRVDEVLDGELACLPNPLAKEEGKLCKFANERTAVLSQACAKQLKVECEKPFAVGVDSFGVDVRLTFGLAQIEVSRVVASSDEAKEEIEALGKSI
jgi:hypothetical protein